MTGVWAPAPGGVDGFAGLRRSLYNREAQARIQKLGEADDPLLRCLPYGVPRAVGSSPWPFQIVQRQGMMVVLTEDYHGFRLIPTHGSPHPPDMLPTYFGDSACCWEGDTLVVDVAGFNDKTWLADDGIDQLRRAEGGRCTPTCCGSSNAGAWSTPTRSSIRRSSPIRRC